MFQYKILTALGSFLGAHDKWALLFFVVGFKVSAVTASDLSGIKNAFEQSLATNVSAQFPEVKDKPVYQLSHNLTFENDVSLTNDAHWLVNGRVAVGNDRSDSATLYVEKGTTVFGQEGDDYLVVRRGSKIHAVGTEDAPIVFTSVQDVKNQETAHGQWGGLMLLGNAPVNLCPSDTMSNCDVVAEGNAGLFGGNEPNDDSGELRYVIIKHAGKALDAGDELNGLTLAGIGDRTRISFVQVHQNLDDGIELFGGTVNLKHVVLTENLDDSLDWTFGWKGHAQFIYIEQTESSDNAIEADNNERNFSATPPSEPTVSNITIVSPEPTSAPSSADGIRLRNGTGGKLRNVLVIGQTGYRNCLRINGEETQENATSGLLSVTHSILSCESSSLFGNDFTHNYFTNESTNSLVDNNELPLLENGYMPAFPSTLTDSGLDMSEVDSFFTPTSHMGAFDGINDWMTGWAYGFSRPRPQPTVLVLQDITGDGVSELVTLNKVGIQNYELSVLNGINLELSSTIAVPGAFSSVTLHKHSRSSELTSNSVGVLGIRADEGYEGRIQYQVIDISQSSVVKSFAWPANWKQVSVLFMSDLTGDGEEEVAIQGVNTINGRTQLVVRNGVTGAAEVTFNNPDIFTNQGYLQLSDFNEDSLEDIGFFGNRRRNGRFQVRVTDGGNRQNRLGIYNFPDNWNRTSFNRLSDTDEDGIKDWGMFGIRKDTGRPQLINKNGNSTRGILRIHSWPADLQNSTLHVIPDMTGDNVNEVAVGGLRGNNRYQLIVKDGVNRGSIVVNVGWPNNWTNAIFQVLPDITADGIVDIALLGRNASGSWDFIIKNGKTRQEISRYDLGSEWMSRPKILFKDDSNDDDIPDFVVFGNVESGIDINLYSGANTSQLN